MAVWKVILYCAAVSFVEITSSNLQALHIFSSDCVTEEPNEVLKGAEKLLTNNAIELTSKMVVPFEDTLLPGNITFILDGSCSNNTQRLSQLSNITYVAYTPFAKNSSNQITFNVYPSLITITQRLCELLNTFDWQEIAIITQLDLIEMAKKMKQHLHTCGIEGEVMFESAITKHDNIVVYLLLTTIKKSQDIICQAYMEGLGYPNSMLILFDWYNEVLVTNKTSSCSQSQLQSVLENTLTIQVKPITNNVTDYNTTLNNLSCLIPDIPNTSFTTYALEALWVLIETSQYHVNDIQDEIINLNTPGLQGQIKFDNNGVRIGSVLNVYQYRQENLVHVAIIDDELEFLNTSGILESISTILPGQSVIIRLPIAIITTFYITASIGIIFTTICLIFNIVYRNTKIMKLSSTNLNYLIIIGSYWLYINTYFLLFTENEKNPTFYEVFINITYTTTVSFSLCDGTIQGKMFRIFYIFHKPTIKKKRITDWHIVIYVCVLVAIDLIVFITTVSHPEFRPKAFLIPSSEFTEDTNALGVNTTYVVYLTFSTNLQYSIIHFSLIYGFRILLDVGTVVIAFLSCLRIKKKVVNDAKSVMSIVYINAIISISNFIIFSTLGQFYYLRVIFGCFSLIIIPTNILMLTFIPKMFEVYKDPEASTLFTVTQKGPKVAII